MISKRLVRVGLWLASAMLLLLVGYAINPPKSLDSAHATTPIIDDDSITITIGSANNITLNMSSLSSDGTFASSNPGTFTVSTTDEYGYTVGIVTDDDEGRLVSESNNAYIPSITSASNIIDTRNSWGYSPSKYDSMSNTDYLPSPTTEGNILNVTQCANNTDSCPSESDEYSIKVGANIGYDSQIGSYEKSFAIMAVGNSLFLPHDITYNKNTVDDVTTMPIPASETKEAFDEYEISYTVPLREGYLFAGWCAGATASNGNEQYCPNENDFYQSGDSVVITKDLNLNAIWIPISEGVIVHYDGNGLFYDNEATTMVNTMTFKVDCTYDESTGEDECVYSVAGGKYRKPIGYQDSWNFLGNTIPLPGSLSDETAISYILAYVNTDTAGYMRGRTTTAYATNENTVTIVFNSSGLMFENGNASNVVVYQWDESSNGGNGGFVNLAGEYLTPIGFDGY